MEKQGFRLLFVLTLTGLLAGCGGVAPGASGVSSNGVTSSQSDASSKGDISTTGDTSLSSDSSSGSGVVLPTINFAITPRGAPTEASVAASSATAIAKAIEDEAAKSTFTFPSAKRSYIEITKENGVTDYNEIQSIQGSQYYQRIYNDNSTNPADGAFYLFSQSGKHYWAVANKVSGVLKTRYLTLNDADFAKAIAQAETEENVYGGQINVAAKARYTALKEFDGSAELPAGTTFYSSGAGNLAISSVEGEETLDLRFDKNLPVYDYSVVNKAASLAAASSLSEGMSIFNWSEATPLTPDLSQFELYTPTSSSSSTDSGSSSTSTDTSTTSQGGDSSSSAQNAPSVFSEVTPIDFGEGLGTTAVSAAQGAAAATAIDAYQNGASFAYPKTGFAFRREETNISGDTAFDTVYEYRVIPGSYGLHIEESVEQSMAEILLAKDGQYYKLTNLADPIAGKRTHTYVVLTKEEFDQEMAHTYMSTTGDSWTAYDQAVSQGNQAYTTLYDLFHPAAGRHPLKAAASDVFNYTIDDNLFAVNHHTESDGTATIDSADVAYHLAHDTTLRFLNQLPTYFLDQEVTTYANGRPTFTEAYAYSFDWNDAHAYYPNLSDYILETA